MRYCRHQIFALFMLATAPLCAESPSNQRQDASPSSATASAQSDQSKAERLNGSDAEDTSKATPAGGLMVLQNGVPVNGTTNSAVPDGDFQDYSFTIPAGTTSLTVTMDNLTADLDLYLRFGSMPTLTTHDCRPFLGATNAETCNFTNPTAGTWFVRVSGFATGAQSFRVTATWTGGAATQTLNVTRLGSGTGTVTSTPAGINCGASCSATFANATSVSLSPVAAGGSGFVGWAGDCTGTGSCVVAMTQTRNVTATFNADGNSVFGGAWINLGAAPAQNGQNENILNREVVGAINAAAPHPSNASILYAASVNGGIWRTANATAASPTWAKQTDALSSLSLRALKFDPTDASSLTLVAGSGRNSSLGGRGGAQIGMLRTVDGGNNWTVLDGGGTLVNQNIAAVEARGVVLLAAATSGLYRSANTGSTFTQLSGGAGSGLPTGTVTDLVGDPSNTSRFYLAAMGTTRGIYASSDTGITWTKVSDATVDALLVANGRVRMAAGASGQLFVATVASGRLSAVFRKESLAGAWATLGIPTTAEQNGVLIGINPGGQGNTHLSIAADPTNSNIVYLGGDRQPFFGEGVPGSNQFFPNSVGAMDYSGRLFRGDASQPVASVWSLLTHTGTANNSSPHADSRGLVFDAAGNLIETDDGGIYKRTSPRLSSGLWVSLNGDIEVTEYHSMAYDGLSDRVIGGAQDTGTTEQTQSGSRTFNSVATADGGDTAVDDISSATISARYASFQNLGSFRRRTYNAANVFQSQVFPSLTPIGGSPAMTQQFYSPVAVNRTNGLRLLILANNGVYESLDQGGTVTQISTVRGNSIVGSPVVYGSPGNAAYVHLASDARTYTRTMEGGTLNQLAHVFPLNVVDVDIDSAQVSRLFAITATTVYLSTDSGAVYSDISGNLSSLSPGNLRSMVLVPRAIGNALVVGTDRGTFISFSPAYNSWQRLGSGLPNAGVYELSYHVGRDVLIGGLLGRGAWRLNNLSTATASASIFRNGFE